MSQSCKQDIIKGVGIVTPFLAAAATLFDAADDAWTHPWTTNPPPHRLPEQLEPHFSRRPRPPLIRGSIGVGGCGGVRKLASGAAEGGQEPDEVGEREKRRD